MKSFGSKGEAVEYIYSPYIIRNGKKIFPKKSKVFRFPKTKKSA